MAQQYSGIANNVPVITIPDDNDIADAESVDRVFRPIWDSMRLVLEQEGGAPIHQRVRLRSIDAAKVEILQVSQWLQNIKAFAPQQFAALSWPNDEFTVLDLDSGGLFDINKVYYCYLGWDNATSTFKRRISLNPPDDKLVFQAADPFLRYVGCFRTNLSRNITAFHKYGDYYSFEDAQTVISPVDTTAVTINLNILIPVKCRKIRLRVEQYNVNPALPDQCIISAGGPSQVLPIGKGADVQQSTSLDLPLRTQVLSAQLQSTGGNIAVVKLEGFWEA